MVNGYVQYVASAKVKDDVLWAYLFLTAFYNLLNTENKKKLAHVKFRVSLNEAKFYVAFKFANIFFPSPNLQSIKLFKQFAVKWKLFLYFLLLLLFQIGIFVVYFLDYTMGCGWWVMVLYLIQIFAIFIVRGRPYSADRMASALFPKRDCTSGSPRDQTM